MLAFALVDEPDETVDASPDVAMPPGAGARRDSAAPVRVALFVGIRLCVLGSLLENIGWPDALFGPEELAELSEPLLPLVEEPEPPPEDVPPPEPAELEDEGVVVRGTA